MARPQKQIKWEVVLKRMQCGNTAEQIYTELELAPNTFYNRFKEEFGVGFGDYCDGKSHEAGKGNIIFTQYVKALSGNTRMLELLGQEWCGQGQNKQINPLNDDINAIRHENMILRAELREIKEKLNANQSEAR